MDNVSRKHNFIKPLREQDATIEPEQLLPKDLTILSHQHRVRKPSETLFGAAVSVLASRGISPSETLHVGSNLERDIGPAKKHGMKTALYAADKTSLSASKEQLKEPKYRPDVYADGFEPNRRHYWISMEWLCLL